jgi:phosphatidylglycerophosphate synthase
MMVHQNTPKPERRKFRQETVIHSYITRPLALELIRLIWNTGITPNQLTIFRIILNIVSIFMFYTMDFFYIAIGFVLFQIHEVIDGADGLYARLSNQTSKLGLFLEHFFDEMFSSNYSLFGFIIALGAFHATNDAIYLYLYCSMAIGSILTSYYRRQFFPKHNKGDMENLDHDKEEFLQIFGVPWKQGIFNLLYTVYSWQNQFILFGLLLYYPLSNALGVNTLLLGFIIVAILNQLSWLQVSYKAFKYALKADKDKKNDIER